MSVEKAEIEDRFDAKKQALKAAITDYADRKDEFESITLVGSHATESPVHRVNDIDIVFVYDEIDEQRGEQLLQHLEQIADDLSDDLFGVTVETRLGPFKKATQDPVTIQIHAIIFDEQRYSDYVSQNPLISLDWQRHDPLYGRSLHDIRPASIPDRDGLLDTRRGIDKQIEQIETNTIIATATRFSGDNLRREKEPITPTDRQKAEMYHKGVKNTLQHLYKIDNHVNERPDQQQLTRFLEDLLYEQYGELFHDLSNLDGKARTGVPLTKEELEEGQKHALQILRAIKEQLQQTV